MKDDQDNDCQDVRMSLLGYDKNIVFQNFNIRSFGHFSEESNFKQFEFYFYTLMGLYFHHD